ncbi:MAG: tetratricopeptide repeat protein [Deltaproteobacteria bacterium]|nr:tetratricopeptide repeat protein [Deltaproteobacteria bacterium]
MISKSKCCMAMLAVMIFWCRCVCPAVAAPDPNRGDHKALTEAAAAMEHGERDRAKAILEARLQEADEPHHFLHYLLGNICYQDGEFRQAKIHYQTALASEPDNPDMVRNLALTLYRLEEFGPSAEALRRAWALGGEEETDLLVHAAQAWAQVEDWVRGERVAAMAAERMAKLDVNLVRLRLYMATKADRLDQAERIVLQALARKPDEQVLWSLLAGVAIDEGQTVRALAVMETERVLTNITLDDNRKLVFLYDRAGLPGRAARVMETSKAEDLEQVAFLFIRAGDIERALSALKEAQKIEPSTERLKTMAFLSFELARPEQAMVYALDGLQADPADDRLRILAAHCALLVEDYPTARKSLSSVGRQSRHAEYADKLLDLLPER